MSCNSTAKIVETWRICLIAASAAGVLFGVFDLIILVYIVVKKPILACGPLLLVCICGILNCIFGRAGLSQNFRVTTYPHNCFCRPSHPGSVYCLSEYVDLSSDQLRDMAYSLIGYLTCFSLYDKYKCFKDPFCFKSWCRSWWRKLGIICSVGLSVLVLCLVAHFGDKIGDQKIHEIMHYPGPILNNLTTPEINHILNQEIDFAGKRVVVSYFCNYFIPTTIMTVLLYQIFRLERGSQLPPSDHRLQLISNGMHCCVAAVYILTNISFTIVVMSGYCVRCAYLLLMARSLGNSFSCVTCCAVSRDYRNIICQLAQSIKAELFPERRTWRVVPCSTFRQVHLVNVSQ